jgi:hypothetical protein
VLAEQIGCLIWGCQSLCTILLLNVHIYELFFVSYCKILCEMFVKYCEFLILTNVLNQGPWISAVVASMLAIASLS